MSNTDEDAMVALEAVAEAEASPRSSQKTAALAAKILCEMNEGYRVPTTSQRTALLVEFARKNKVIYGKAFDVVRCPPEVDLNDSASIAKNLAKIILCEIKSTNNPAVKDDFQGVLLLVVDGRAPRGPEPGRSVSVRSCEYADAGASSTRAARDLCPRARRLPVVEHQVLG